MGDELHDVQRASLRSVTGGYENINVGSMSAVVVIAVFGGEIVPTLCAKTMTISVIKSIGIIVVKIVCIVAGVVISIVVVVVFTNTITTTISSTTTIVTILMIFPINTNTTTTTITIIGAIIISSIIGAIS